MYKKMNDYITDLITNLTTKKNGDVNIKDIEKSILSILQHDRRILENREIIGVGIKTKSYIKHNKIEMGQVYEIFLNDINMYSYGVVVDVSKDKETVYDIIIGYLNVYAADRLPVDKLLEVIYQKEFTFYASTGLTGIRNSSWKLVTNILNRIYSKEEILKIPYVVKFMDKFYISIGNPLLEISKCSEIKEEKYNSILNPLGIIGQIEIEEKLVELYQAKNKYN